MLRLNIDKGGDTLQVLPAGLPDIQGTFWDYGMSDKENLTGAFTESDYAEARGGHQTTSFKSKGILLQASLYNSIYGASDTVTPPSLSLIPQIKY